MPNYITTACIPPYMCLQNPGDIAVGELIKNFGVNYVS